MAVKPKAKKKKMTLDDFAVAIQRDLAHMATKDDIRELRENMATKLDIKQIHGRLRDLSDDVKTVTDAMVSKADLTGSRFLHVAGSHAADAQGLWWTRLTKSRRPSARQASADNMRANVEGSGTEGAELIVPAYKSPVVPSHSLIMAPPMVPSRLHVDG